MPPESNQSQQQVKGGRSSSPSVSVETAILIAYRVAIYCAFLVIGGLLFLNVGGESLPRFVVIFLEVVMVVFGGLLAGTLVYLLRVAATSTQRDGSFTRLDENHLVIVDEHGTHLYSMTQGDEQAITEAVPMRVIPKIVRSNGHDAVSQR